MVRVLGQAKSGTSIPSSSSPRIPMEAVMEAAMEAVVVPSTARVALVFQSKDPNGSSDGSSRRALESESGTSIQSKDPNGSSDGSSDESSRRALESKSGTSIPVQGSQWKQCHSRF